MNTRLPEPHDRARQAVYDGEIFLLPATGASLRLAEAARETVRQAFADVHEDPRQAQHHLSDEAFFERVGRLRRELYTSPEHQETVRHLLREHGFDPAGLAFDPIRIRAIAHRGYDNPKAAPIYYPHRDTWYANPQAQMTWWLPLHDVEPEETFVFFPDFFAKAVPNNSERFDYAQWTAGGTDLRIGWQDPKAGEEALYPGQQGAVQDRPVGFRAAFGQVLLFAGAHLHETLRNETGRTRFSIDFRTVHLGDLQAGRGAPNADNRCTGSAVVDWIKP